jgi:hypothetical protein
MSASAISQLLAGRRTETAAATIITIAKDVPPQRKLYTRQA